jgi:hypothetical protein
MALVGGPILLLAAGCISLLPSAETTVNSPWGSFDEAKLAFDRIVPHETTAAGLKELGFDPFSTPNIEILTYLDIIQRFMPNPSIKPGDLDEDLRACISVRDCCVAYEVDVREVESWRYGNVLLDVFGFRRKTREAGWEFKALIVLRDDIVVYKLWGGKPRLNESRKRKNPLGPLQESGDLLLEAGKGAL